MVIQQLDINYYRLKPTDINGNYTYSNIVVLRLIRANFVFQQNYPNPFNPSTTIKYYIPAQGNVSFKVYDINGKKLQVWLMKIRKQENIPFNLKHQDLQAECIFISWSRTIFRIKEILFLK